MFGKYQDIPTATAVAEDYGSTYKSDGVQVTRGQVQPPAFRDPFFGFLFLAQASTVVVLSAMYATGKIEVDFDDITNGGKQRHLMEAGRFLKSKENMSALPLMIGCLSSLVVAPAVTVGLFSFMHRNATRLIQMSLYTAIATNVILTVVLLISGVFWPAILTGLGAFFTWMYARYVWHRIPLAAANLKVAIASIQSQLGVAFLGLATIPVYLVWWALWIYFFLCTLNTPFMKSQVESTKIVHSSGFKGDDDYVNTLEASYSSLWYFLVFLMLVSFYWTIQVIGNTVQTTVAGSVGTFWFVPEEAMGCCSPALGSSLFRSLTYSFGSICLGSLIVAIIQAMQAMVRQAEEQARNNRDGGGALILCLAQCLLSMLEAAAEYFNKWAFIYTGLYGYSYLEAGHNVLTLFRERGWTTIINDNLTARVLGMLSFVVGLGTGVIAAVISLLAAMTSSSSMADGSVGAMAGGSLVLAVIVGMILASIIFNVVNAATDTIIVLFAEAPTEFQQNHPVLAAEMNEAWLKAYPDMFSPSPPTMVV
jgi:hypothetical protein